MKSERVSQLELILKSHPEGLRKSDLARRIGVHRSTIGRYIDELKQFEEVYEDNNMVKVADALKGEEQLSLSVYESLALKMSAEMLMKNSQEQNPHLVSALRKIALSMEKTAPTASHDILDIAEQVERQSSGKTSFHSSVLEVLIDAWISGRMVKIITSEEEETELAPYFIGFVEGETGRNPITVTGRLRHTTEIVTIDISQIKDVQILSETYTIPDNLKPFRGTDNNKVTDVIDTIPLVLNVKQKSALNSFRSLIHSEIKTEKIEGDMYRCSFDAENSIELILRIIQCFNSVEVVGPPKFREKFTSILRQIIALYD